MNFLDILTSVVGILMSVGHFPQLYMVIKNKSGANISRITYGVFAIGTTVWLVYGILNINLPVILSYTPGVVGSWLVLGFSVYYGNRTV